jgi:hypothetical protein
MKWKLYIPIFIFLFSSCEKNQDENNILLKFYGNAFEDIGYSVALTDDGYIISGQLTEMVSYTDGEKAVKKPGIIKVGNDGKLIWKTCISDRQTGVALKVISLDDGSVISTGFIIDSSTLRRKLMVVRLNPEGSVALQKVYGNSGNQSGTDIIKTTEGFMVLGTTDVERQPLTEATGNMSGKTDVLLLRINNNLEQIVVPTAIGYLGNDAGSVIKKDINGGYIVAGTTDRSESGKAGNNIFLLKINSDGSATQPVIFDNSDDEYAADIEILSDGYLIAGTVGADGTDQSVYISKISKNIYDAPLLINKIKIPSTSSSINSFSVKAISRYKTSSFVMAGLAGSGSSAKMLIFIADAEGNPVPGKVMIAGSTGSQIAYDVVSETGGDIIAVGKNSYEKTSMISLLKFRF